LPTKSNSKFTCHYKCKAVEAEEIKIHRIRITLTSRKVEALEKVCLELKNKALSKNLKVSGPVRMPTKFLKLIVRKSPCGEGTNTYDRWQMRIHKRILDIHSPADVVRQITNISIEPGVDIEVIIVDL
jgi:small subunit ribosomal protein S20e